VRVMWLIVLFRSHPIPSPPNAMHAGMTAPVIKAISLPVTAHLKLSPIKIDTCAGLSISLDSGRYLLLSR